MSSQYLNKHPSAVKQFVFDFAQDIPENDFIGDYTITAFDSDDIDRLEEVVRSVVINPTDITVEFQAGIDGQNYRVTVIVTLDVATTTPTKIMEMRVRSREV
jgi:hypothetical protein